MIDARLVTDWRPRHRARGKVELSACRLLRELASEVPADEAIVELGAFRGRSTGWLLLGAQDGHGAHVTTIDPWGDRTDSGYAGQVRSAAVAESAFRAWMARIGADETVLTVRRALAADVGRQWAGPPVGLLWHDAGHGAGEVEADLLAWLPHMAAGSVVLLHDAARRDYGVVEGAERVLDAPGWDWAGREARRWQRKPHRRGVLLVRAS